MDGSVKERTNPKSAKTGTAIADRDTPLIKDCWYVLDWSAEVSNELKNRMVLGQDLVYFRDQEGEVCALQNRCAHRCFPLHRSNLLENDTIQCGYHGLIYNTSGQCVKIPSAPDKKTSGIKVQKYPVVDRAPMIWVWPGDPEKADPALIPDYDWVNTKEWGYGHGFYHLEGNYLAIHENLMDITHFSFLHGSALGTPGHAESKIDVSIEGSVVDNYRINHGEHVPDLHRDYMGIGFAPVSRDSHSKFMTPGFHYAYSLYQDTAGTLDGRTDYNLRILHFISPETQYTTNYWWMFARDFKPEDKKASQFYSDTTLDVFREDGDAIEWMEQQWANEDRPDFQETHVPADKGAVEMRRIIKRMAEEENIQPK